VNASHFMTGLIGMSAKAGVLVVLVLLVQWCFRKQLTFAWRSALWLLLVVRLLLPVSSGSALSIFNLFLSQAPKTARPLAVPPQRLVPLPAPQPGAVKAAPKPSVSSIAVAAPAVNRSEQGGKIRPISRSTVVIWVWLAGAIGLLAHMVIASVLVNRRLAHAVPLADPAVLALLRECRLRLGVKTDLAIM
jgi:bla regulator protein BlaR1